VHKSILLDYMHIQKLSSQHKRFCVETGYRGCSWQYSKLKANLVVKKYYKTEHLFSSFIFQYFTGTASARL